MYEDFAAAALNTPRLLLRPSMPDDAARAFEIQSDWEVTRMLRMARFPADCASIQAWFTEHPAVTGFAFARLGLSGLRSGHAADNPASGRILSKLGYRLVESRRKFSLARL